jgi:nucleoside-diphosphate-sugar epimerase
MGPAGYGPVQVYGEYSRWQTLLPLQQGDVPDSLADVDALTRDIGCRASTPIEEGVKRFVEWYRSYYCPQTA